MSTVRAEPGELAFKAYEIEELADVYFFRPLGMVLARAARSLGLSPTAVTLIGTGVGMTGGLMLASPRVAFAGFIVLVMHSVLDSSDGQLARMTGRVSEFGRVLDGVGGYLTHIAIYVGILAGLSGNASFRYALAWALAAAAANVVHAQMYDYHRSTYAEIAIRARATGRGGHRAVAPERPATLAGRALALYERMERTLSGLHPKVEVAVARRSEHGIVSAADRQRYRACFYWPVRGWNVLGDNTRFYAIGVFAVLRHIEWFFPFVLVPMNVALVVLWWWQARADRQFLHTL